MEMKWNRILKRNTDACDTVREVYDIDIAIGVAEDDNLRIGANELTVMMQENVRMGILDNSPLVTLKCAFSCQCGYCISVQKRCERCPLGRYGEFTVDPIKGECYDDVCYAGALNAGSIEEFAEMHELWCRRYGLWQEHWI